MRKRNPQNGFTMLEALVATAIFFLILVGMSTVFSTNRSTYDRGQVRVEVQQNARVAMEIATRELRHAGCDPSNAIQALAQKTAFQAADSQTLTYVGDVNADNVDDRVVYQLQGTVLERGFSTWDGTAFPVPATSTLAEGIAVLTFTYFDTNGVAIGAPVAASALGDITRVVIDMGALAETTEGTQETFVLNADVSPRNL